MRFLIVGNLQNDGYSVAKELRSMNVDVDLAVEETIFIGDTPEWEDADVPEGVDPYTAKRSEIKINWTPPPWIRYFNLLNSPLNLQNNFPRNKFRLQKTLERIKMMKMMREYDILQTHVPFAIYAQFTGVPYVQYDAGWIRYFPQGRTFRDGLARRAYKHARLVMFTNFDTFGMLEALPYIDKSQLRFCSFAIDPEKYRPTSVPEIRERFAKPDEFLIFAPARQVWHEKGNDMMLRAFARFLKIHPKAKMMMMGWSVDETKSKELATSLGINDRIIWMKPVAKKWLIRYYNAADAVLDQFKLGGIGTLTPEAMSCGRPVLIYIKERDAVRAFGEIPPMLNSPDEDAIVKHLVDLSKDPDYAQEVGKRSRDWILRTHHPRIIAKRHLEIMEEAYYGKR